MDTGSAALIIAIIGIVVFGGVAQQYLKSTKASREAFGTRIKKLEDRQQALEDEMEKQKELVADAVIDQS